ncbi:MAG: bifunctional UDP-N-acetylglucosamine diphosphorylase/glucosamine-1-phosphate N-acetyltransferase GlmU [Pseudomonadota bacterium]
MATETVVVVLAAGHGTRMRSDRPKVLHEIGALSLLGHVMQTASELSPIRKAVVVGDHSVGVKEAVNEIDPSATVAIQSPPQGTGDAVQQASHVFDSFNGVVIVLYADTPLIRRETLECLAAKVEAGAAVSVLGFEPDEPGGYGRLKRSQDGNLEAIVEAKDASDAELAIRLVNSGVMAFDAAFLQANLPNLSNNNAKGEYYLTDLVEMAVTAGRTCDVIIADENEVVGVNSQAELAYAEHIYQQSRRDHFMESGVTLLDPRTTYFSSDTHIEPGVIIEPNVFLGPRVRVERGVRIKAFCHLEGATVGAGCQIGPFARLRPGTEISQSAKIGNFVEVKKAHIGESAAISHLSYIGDASVGASANIGAGTITCNYDGKEKHTTTIGDRAFVGSNSSLVAPVEIGNDAYIGSGSVITRDVSAEALSVARGRQRDIPNWVAKRRPKGNNDDAS